MPDSDVMPGRSKLAGVYMIRQSSFSRSPGTEFRTIEKSAPTPFATISSREKRCLPVNPSKVSTKPIMPNATSEPVIGGARGIGRIGAHSVRQEVGNDEGREGVANLVHPSMARVLGEPSFLDRLESIA